MPDGEHPDNSQPEERPGDERPGKASIPPRRRAKPSPPVQSREDTDIAWGERPEPDDTERYYRDRPPHWDSA